MTDRARDRNRPLPTFSEEAHQILTAAAQVLDGTAQQQYAITYKTWQDELWAYTYSVGEYASVLNWFASGFSRMHLRAGIWKPGLREPELLETGPAVEFINDLVVNARGGEAAFLRKWAKYLFVPGTGVFLAEDRLGRRTYDVKSNDVIRRSAQVYRDPVTLKEMPLYDIRTAPSEWRTTSPESIVGRIFDPDMRFDYLPTSMSQAALTTLREIDLYNRHIVATLLSRIAFNGFLMIPSEVTFPVNKEFKDAPDPFIAELLHYASRGIKDPGSPGSAIPFPLRVPAQFIDKFQHLIVASGIDPKVIEARQSAITRLAEQLPAPPEALTGIQDMNHWNAWKSSEDSVKIYFGPPMEILCGGLTELFLHPMLLAANKPLTQDGGHIVVWYDASDLTVQPDNSENARDAADRGWVTIDSYLEAIGLDPDDKPKIGPELREQILVSLASRGTPVPDSFYLLFPEDKPSPEQAAEDANAARGLKPGESPVTGGAPAAGPSGASPVSGNNVKTGTPEKKREAKP